MDLQFTISNYGFHQHQGVHQILPCQAGDTIFHSVAPNSGVLTQPWMWPEHHGYQFQRYPGPSIRATTRPPVLPVTEIPIFQPIPAQGYRGMPIQEGPVPFDPWLQGPVLLVEAMDQQYDTSVALYAEQQAPLVATRGIGPQYGAPVPKAPPLQGPIMYVDAKGQQPGTAGPFNPLLQPSSMLVDGDHLPHGTCVPFNPYLPAPLVPMDATRLQLGTAVPFTPLLASSVPVPPIATQEFPSIEKLAAGLSSTGPMAKGPVEQNHQDTESGTTLPMRPEGTTSTEAQKAQDGHPQAETETQPLGTSNLRKSLVVQPKSLEDDTRKQQQQRVLEDAEAKPADKSTSIKQALKSEVTSAVEVGKTDTNLPKTPSTSLARDADKCKDKKRKLKNEKGEKERKEKQNKKPTSPAEKKNITGDGETKVSGSEKQLKTKLKDSSKRSKVKEEPVSLQHRSKLGERMMHSVQVFHKLGGQIEKVKPQKPTPEETAQKPQPECPGLSGVKRNKPQIPFPINPYRIAKVQSTSTVEDLQRTTNGTACQRADNVPDHVTLADRKHQPASSQNKPSTAPPSQSRPSERGAQELPSPARQRRHYKVPHYYKNHALGSIGDYGDGERMIYLRPEYSGMFPIPLSNLPPLPPGAPRRFHCREYSVPIPAEQRDKREAMKREAKLRRDEAAKITHSGMDCSVLADRRHLPYDPWPTDDNWWESGLEEVWKYDECLEGLREDIVLD